MKGDIVDCEGCGKAFEQKRRDQRFCNDRCRYESWSRTHPRLETGKSYRIEVDEAGRLVIVQEAEPVSGQLR